MCQKISIIDSLSLGMYWPVSTNWWQICYLRLVAICVTAYAAFLRFKLAALRYCDVKFCDSQE